MVGKVQSAIVQSDPGMGKGWAADLHLCDVSEPSESSDGRWLALQAGWDGRPRIFGLWRARSCRVRDGAAGDSADEV